MARAPRPPAPRVLHQDEDLLVIDKPVGVPVGYALDDEPLLNELIPEPVDWPDAWVWLLETDASGVAVLARTEATREEIRRQVVAGEGAHVQLALVGGYVADDGQVEVPLKFDGSAVRSRVNRRRGTPATTTYRIVERVAGHTLLECRPVPGLRHQTRAHLANAGHPLTVDPRYGGGREIMLSVLKAGYRPSRRHPERPLIARLTLHTLRVAFQHPVTNADLDFEVEPPKDFRAVVSQLGRLL